MRKFYTLLSAMALTALAANAQDLGKATLTSDFPEGYTTYPSTTLTLSWYGEGEEAEELTFVSDNPVVKVTINDKVFEVTPEYGTTWEGDVEETNQAEISISFYSEYEELNSPKSATISVTIPEGLVKNASEETNAAQTFSYTLLETIDSETYKYTPEQGKYYPPSMLSQVSVIFPVEVEAFQNLQTIYVDGAGDPALTGVSIKGNTLTVSLKGVEPGALSISIPAMYVKSGNMVNDPIYITYEVFDGLPSAEVIYGPQEMSNQASGLVGSMYLTWDYQTIVAGEEFEGATLSYYSFDYETEETVEIPTAALTFAYIEKPSGEPGTPEYSTRADEENAEEENNVVIIDVESLLPDNFEGYVTIEIPEGFVSNSEYGINPAESFNFNVYNYTDVEATITLDEEDGIINIAWEDLSVTSWDANNSLFVSNSEGERTEITISYMESEDAQAALSYNDDFQASVNIYLDNLNLADGTYSLCIPDNCFILADEEDNYYLAPTQYYTFTYEGGEYSGIKALESAGVKAEVKGVYNLQGVKVANDANGLTKLPAGLYIINGKKVMLRK